MKTETPNDAWTLYVGQQTTTEFMANSRTDDPDAAVAAYQAETAGGEFEFDDEVAGLLVQHIERNA